MRLLCEKYSIHSSSYHFLYINDEGQMYPTASSSSATRCTEKFSTTVYISRQTWSGEKAGASSATSLKILNALLEIICGSVNGDIDVMLVFIPADASSSATTSKLAQLLPDFLPHVSVSACAVFRPLDTGGTGSMHCVLGMQYVLTYCRNVLVRDMSDYLRLFTQFCNAPPSISDLCKSVASDLVLIPLVHTSLLWSCLGAGKLVDYRSSIWHKEFADGANAVRQDRGHDPARAVTATLHALSLEAVERKLNTPNAGMKVKIAQLMQIKIEPRQGTGVTSKTSTKAALQERYPRRVSCVPVDAILMKTIAKQIPSATPHCTWPVICEIQYCGRSAGDHRNSGVDGAVEAVLVFDSPFAAQKLRAVLRLAEVLLCVSKGAFLQR